MNDKYSNFTDGFMKAMVLLPILGVVGVYTLYRVGQGSKKEIKIFGSAIATMFLLGIATKQTGQIRVINPRTKRK